jgi:hypothetical protein
MKSGICMLIGTILLAACSAEQIADTAQALQQHQCGKISDKIEYDRCMSRAEASNERP